jgi:hypothetical protein
MRLRNTNGSVPRVAKLLSCGTGYIYHMVWGKHKITHKNFKKINDELIRINDEL